MTAYLALGAVALAWGNLRGHPNVWHLSGQEPVLSMTFAGILGGLAALSLDALSSVAYGPQVMISVLAAALLVPVGAETNSLIPMFTIGVFVGFTLSHVGLVVHWRRGARRAGGFVRR